MNAEQILKELDYWAARKEKAESMGETVIKENQAMYDQVCENVERLVKMLQSPARLNPPLELLNTVDPVLISAIRQLSRAAAAMEAAANIGDLLAFKAQGEAWAAAANELMRLIAQRKDQVWIEQQINVDDVFRK